MEARPVRVGLVFKASAESAHLAVQQATSTWGGVYHPFLSSQDAGAARRLADALAVDVMYAVDSEPASERLAELSGYRWRGRHPRGPFDPPRGRVTTRLLGPEWLLDESGGSRFVLPRWDPADPLSGLYAVWFGQYGSSEYESGLASRFAAAADEVSFGPTDARIADLAGRLTPIGLTGLDIEYASDRGTTGIVVLDAQDPMDLVRFWNLRACGGHVFPWPVGHGERFAQAASLWLQHALNSGRISRRPSGTGQDRGPYVEVWVAQRQQPAPDPLPAVLGERGVTAVVRSWDARWAVAGGWTGNHPLHTDFSRTFSAAIAPHEPSLTLPMPPVGPPRWRSSRHQAGVVAAHVTVFSESDLGPDRTIAVPNVRELAALLAGDANVPEAFHRPTGDGRVLGIQVDTDRIIIDPVRSLSVFERLLDGSGWTCAQTDNGRFASRLIELLGGTSSTAGNQPAVRAVLDEAARTPRGKPISALIQTAKRYRGSWPGPISSPAGSSGYPKEVVYYLLARRLLRPVLPMKCPRCATESVMRPEDLAAEISCEMCSEAFPLGLALGLARRPIDWLYRLAGNIPAERLAETLPVTASLTVLSLYRQLSPTAVPHVLGLQLTAPNHTCEVDLAVALNDGGLPVVVVGEVKSYRDSIDESDLANLARVQQHLRCKNIECFVLAATLRDALQPDELTAVRAFCEDPPDTVYPSHRRQPVLPIVLTGRDLSAPQHTDEHPLTWPHAEAGVAGLAVASCRRNLGLIQVSDEPTADGVTYRLSWA